MTFKIAKKFKGFSINLQMVYRNFQESLSIPLLSDQATEIITQISLCFSSGLSLGFSSKGI